MISIENRHFHKCTSTHSFLSVYKQRAMIVHKYYYARLLTKGMNRICSTSCAPNERCTLGWQLKLPIKYKWCACKGLAARAMMHNAVQRSVVSHCAYPTVPVDIWAKCNSVSWDNSTLALVVWIGINSWLLRINLRINSQATKLSYFCVETYKWFRELSCPCSCGDYGS